MRYSKYYDFWNKVKTIWVSDKREKKTIQNSTTFENIKLKTDFNFLNAIKNLSDKFPTRLSDLHLLENKLPSYKTSTKKYFVKV